MIGRSVIALVLVSSQAFADDAATATKLFEEGRALRDANKVDEACSKFEQSLKLDLQLGTVLNLADCREAQGRRIDAYKLFVDGAALAAKTDKKVRETYARQHADALIAKLGRVTVRVADPSQALSIKLGERELPKTEWGTRQIVEPGKVRVIASAPDRMSKELDREVAAGGEVTIEVPVLQPIAGPPPRTGKTPRRSVTPLIVSGSGLVLLGGGIALALSAKSAYDAALDAGGPDVDARIDRAQRRADIATAFTIAGVAATAVGVVLYIRDRRGRVVVGPTAHGDGVGVRLSGPF